MKTGTKSLLFGAHQLLLHPLLVAAAWIKLYGFTWDIRIWIAFFVHDLGYWGKPNMDGPEGERHPETGAKIMHWLFDGWLFYDNDYNQVIDFSLRKLKRKTNTIYFKRKMDWYNFTAYHSRYYAKMNGSQPSQLCYADKMAFVLTPSWFYIPTTTLTGEIQEYMLHANRKTSNKLLWLLRAKLHTLEYVLEHCHGKPDTWTQTQTADPLHTLREETYSNEETNEITGRLIRENYIHQNK
jgi:hypothetical protein